MSRNDGFPTADLDVKFLRDPKVRRLRRLLPDRGDAAAAEHLYLSVVLSSWEDGYRVALEDALTFEAATPERVAALKVELLDDEGKVPLAVWQRWFKPAWDRRERKRAGGREGNRRRWHADRSPGDEPSDTDSHTDSDSESPSVRPSIQSVRPSSGQEGNDVPQLRKPRLPAPAAELLAHWNDGKKASA